MDQNRVYRVFRALYGELEHENQIKTNNPSDYIGLRDSMVKIKTLVEYLDGDEQVFLEWMTRTYQDDGYYRFDIKQYGLYHGKERPICYDNCHKMLKPIITEKIVFDYIYSEYDGMCNAEAIWATIRLTEARTCKKCDTRFDTVEGCHRHMPKCKGIYRGDYHGKVNTTIPGSGITSVW